MGNIRDAAYFLRFSLSINLLCGMLDAKIQFRTWIMSTAHLYEMYIYIYM